MPPAIVLFPPRNSLSSVSHHYRKVCVKYMHMHAHTCMCSSMQGCVEEEAADPRWVPHILLLCPDAGLGLWLPEGPLWRSHGIVRLTCHPTLGPELCAHCCPVGWMVKIIMTWVHNTESCKSLTLHSLANSWSCALRKLYLSCCMSSSSCRRIMYADLCILYTWC